MKQAGKCCWKSTLILILLGFAGASVCCGQKSNYFQKNNYFSTVIFNYTETTESSGANEIAVINSSDPAREFSVQGLLPGRNEIIIPKNGNYLVALVINGNNAQRSTENRYNRSITGAITNLGNIKIISSGMDAIPVQDSAAEEIALGEVTVTSAGVTASASLQTMSTNLNLDENFLEAFGYSDDLLVKFMNPDINGNGVYDDSEGLVWSFQVLYYFAQPYGNNDYDNEIIPFDATGLNPIVRKYFFNALKGFGDLTTIPKADIRLIPPPDHDLTWAGSGEPVEYIPITADQNMSGNPQIWFPQDFAERADTGQGAWINGNIPANGDHILKLGDKSYYIENAKFIVPGTNYNGFIFPLFKLGLQDGLPQSIEWRWYLQKDGVIIPATADHVQTVLHNFSVSYLPAGGGSNTITLTAPDEWAQGSSLSFQESLISGVDYSSYHISMNYVDFAGNNFFWMQTNGGPGMANTINAFNLEVRP